MSPGMCPQTLREATKEKTQEQQSRTSDILLPESLSLEGNDNNYHNNEVNITSPKLKLLSCPKNALEE